MSACSTSGLNQTGQAFVNPQDLLTVDCLLPPQVRQLGTRLSYLAPRRGIRTSGAQCALRGGEYVAYDRADFKSALAVWLPLARQGDPEAQTYVGEIHEKGLGTRASFETAAVWYERAAQQNHARAQINLGYLYESGLGVERDLTRALNLYRQASGFTAAELEYVSSIEVANRQATRERAEQLQSEVHALTSEMQLAQEQLHLQVRHLKESELKVQSLRDEIARRKGIQSTHYEIDIETLHQQLSLREAVLNTQASKIEKLQRRLSSQQASMLPEPIEQVLHTVPGSPSINIIDPPILITRGKPTLALSKGPLKLIGTVEPAKSLFAFRINGQDHPVSENGLFQLDTIPTTPENLDLLAVDTQGASTRLSLSIGLNQAQLVADDNAKTTNTTDTGPRQSLNGVDFGNYHALIIGNDTYASMSNLKTAGNDAIAVEDILREKYGFQTTLLLNANQKTMLTALERMRASLGRNDNLVIYYAGHGELDRQSGRSYWLPTDATANRRTQWIANTAITAMIETMPAKHVLVVADSCYSGTLTRSSIARPLRQVDAKTRLKWLKAVSKSTVRTVLSSGGLRPVLDGSPDSEHSIFAREFINALQQNNDVLEAYRLFFDIQSKVADAAAKLNVQQIPQYAPIRHSGHQAGEFIFVPTAQTHIKAGS